MVLFYLLDQLVHQLFSFLKVNPNLKQNVVDRWNFSVGNHQIEMLPGDKLPHDSEDGEDVCSQTCPS